MTVARKPHVFVDQVDLGGFVSGRDAATLEEISEAFDIHEITARRHLDGLVAQGLLDVFPAERGGRRRTYFGAEQPTRAIR